MSDMSRNILHQKTGICNPKRVTRQHIVYLLTFQQEMKDPSRRSKRSSRNLKKWFPVEEDDRYMLSTSSTYLRIYRTRFESKNLCTPMNGFYLTIYQLN